MKVRIGNDIRLFIRLFNKDKYEDLNINSIKVYIVNTTPDKMADKGPKYISRFPIEPEHPCYEPTNHCINCSGHPSYHTFPKKYIAGSYFHCCHKEPENDFNTFLAPVKATQDRSVVEVLFPAESQMLTGTYKLVVVAKLYKPGYFKDDLKTVTIDYPDVFTLVDSSQEGVDGNITVNIGDIERMINLYGDKNIVVGETYTISADIVDGLNIKWYCSEPNVEFLEQNDYSLVYTVPSLKEDGEDMEFEILALSDKNDQVVGRIRVCVRASRFVGDIHAESGKLNDNGKIEINLNDGNSFDVDMSSKLLWYEGD